MLQWTHGSMCFSTYSDIIYSLIIYNYWLTPKNNNIFKWSAHIHWIQCSLYLNNATWMLVFYYISMWEYLVEMDFSCRFLPFSITRICWFLIISILLYALNDILIVASCQTNIIVAKVYNYTHILCFLVVGIFTFECSTLVSPGFKTYMLACVSCVAKISTICFFLKHLYEYDMFLWTNVFDKSRWWEHPCYLDTCICRSSSCTWLTVDCIEH